MDKVYEPQKYEDEIYKKWEESGFFNPDVCVEKGICKKDAKTFSIVLPPPNITDKLHLGHVVMVAITDILARFYRMKGRRVLWIPGTDHAALASQNVVEKKLLKEKNQTRHDLGRKKFLVEVWQFVNKTQATIIHQLKKTGASLDWSREAFTLDERRQEAVKGMFADMYNEGVIYRGYRIVNWCPRCHTTLSDDEVEHEEKDAKLYTFSYAKDFPFAISTTRPETKLGDTAIAVNPKDERYKKYVGKSYQVDFCGVPLTIKVITDNGVDIDFGTGALGVTPAHSMVDYEMAQKNGIEIKKIINEEGKLVGVGKFSGLSVTEAREAVLIDLDKRELLEKEEDIKNNLAVCSRCDTPIEPLPSKQWFVAVDKKLKRLGGKSLKDKAIEAAVSGKIKFVPERFTKRYLDWMKNLHDWCISRQIWFGHQIPVWYKGEDVFVGIEAPRGEGWEQDSDVLDTWFSSGMWTFSTLGYPDLKAVDLKSYHPTQLLETGYEIITLWVSRMVMMSLFALQEIPFKNVYLHGMVLDKNGKKMSKSKGNGIDPLEMIAKYGTDATRMSLIVGNTPGNDTRMSEEKIADFRNFANKLWNIARFVDSQKSVKSLKSVKPKTLSDKWVLARLNEIIKEVTENIEKFNFSLAGEQLRDFTWNELADWYLEISKIEKDKGEILNYILETILKLWHPFMPFVTETIWANMEHDMLMVSKWPTVIARSPQTTKQSSSLTAVSSFAIIQNIITSIRSLRADYKIDPAKKLGVAISAGKMVGLLMENVDVVKGLARLEDCSIERLAAKPVDSVGFVVDGVEVFVDLSGVVDLKKEKFRLQTEIAEVKKYADSLEKKLANKDFVSRAPASVVEAEKKKLVEARLKLEKLGEQLKSLK
ncbi:MAG: valine--tRNA ligase [Candidatus Magasanikbacteria bacterium RIFCSPLOWO2_01_FULL_43_20b]|nr:MAG: valine--tRNA ligase [Candidatus Magasanikbacteria bacterium RIFCSPHIGHO2_02_FULL_44_13]OGH72152.1 MAG: valine--tRNA ligase [Candidatus Magasanikbacteria bacterium RIFCSPLOWO2_02_FULL_43_22]OGH73471.1 MAG: valine--tRNA ligase [Candidatus Magasanikbacteria bacterium RIFCSPLOWO2_01_FULL_43_20b]